MPKIELYLESIKPKKFGGSCEELYDLFPKSSDHIAMNALPWEACVKDTPYSSIDKSHMPSIVMLERDYKGLKKMRFNNESKRKKDKKEWSYAVKQKELLAKGEFWQVLKNEIADIIAVAKYYELNGKDFVNYTLAIAQMLHYCKDQDVPGAPELAHNVQKGRLINQDQYNVIMNHFKLKVEIA